jgi:hypothetical protein
MQPTPLSTENQALLELNTQIAEAESQRKADFLDKVLSEALRFRRASGVVVDKATYLNDLKDPGNTYEYNVPEDVTPEIYGSLAVVTLLVRAKGTRAGKPFEGTFRNVRIFLNEPGKDSHWQLHSWFNVKVENP